MQNKYIKGRGAQINTLNPFNFYHFATEHPEGIDEEFLKDTPKTEIFYDHSKRVVNKVDSPDLKLDFSINPYQGCEHGCVYCYARNSHNYWGFSAGIDFETKIIIKADAPRLLEKKFLARNWRPASIMLSGNTDCYQPLERKLKITRGLLKVFAKYRNPVGILTKNSLVLRDLDLLRELAKNNLATVFLSITTLNEKLRAKMEPRTASSIKRLKTLQELSEAGIPTGVMTAPIIPGLNDHEIPQLVKAAADHGAQTVSYTVVRLNGAIAEIFKDWLCKNFPDRASKVLRLIGSMHGGKVNDTMWGRRIKGDGKIAQTINQLFTISKNKYFKGRSVPEYDLTKFRRNGNLDLF